MKLLTLLEVAEGIEKASITSRAPSMSRIQAILATFLGGVDGFVLYAARAVLAVLVIIATRGAARALQH